MYDRREDSYRGLEVRAPLSAEPDSHNGHALRDSIDSDPDHPANLTGKSLTVADFDSQQHSGSVSHVRSYPVSSTRSTYNSDEPSLFVKAANTLSDSYFRIKFFESAEFYQSLGVRTLKRWLSSGKNLERIGSPYSVSALREYEKRTRFNEGAHLGAFVFCAVASGLIISDTPWLGAFNALSAIFNFSFVPIQRYNRDRLNKIIRRIEQRNESSL